jgi:hypothetical protein
VSAPKELAEALLAQVDKTRAAIAANDAAADAAAAAKQS